MISNSNIFNCPTHNTSVLIRGEKYLFEENLNENETQKAVRLLAQKIQPPTFDRIVVIDKLRFKKIEIGFNDKYLSKFLSIHPGISIIKYPSGKIELDTADGNVEILINETPWPYSRVNFSNEWINISTFFANNKELKNAIETMVSILRKYQNLCLTFGNNARIEIFGCYSSEELIVTINHLLWNKTSYIWRGPLNKIPERKIKILVEKSKEIPLAIQKLCLESIGNTVMAIITGFLLSPFLHKELCEEFFMDNDENLFSQSALFVVHSKLEVPKIVNILLNQHEVVNDPHFSLKTLEKIIQIPQQITSHGYSSFEKVYQLLKNKYNPEFEIPRHLYEKDENYALHFMIFFSSLNGKQQLECIKYFIHKVSKKEDKTNFNILYCMLFPIEKTEREEIFKSITDNPEKFKIFIEPHLKFGNTQGQWKVNNPKSVFEKNNPKGVSEKNILNIFQKCSQIEELLKKATSTLFTGTPLTPRCQLQFIIWEEITQEWDLPLDNFPEKSLSSFLKKTQAVPKSLQKICMKFAGPTLEAVIIGLLLNPSPDENNFFTDSLRSVFKTFYLPKETLFQNPETYLINIGYIIHEIFNKHPEITKNQTFNLKSIEQLLDKISNDDANHKLLSIDKNLFEFIQKKISPSFEVPPLLYDADVNCKLRLLLLMTSLKESRQIECLEYLIEKGLNEVLKTKNDLHHAFFSILSYLPRKAKIKALCSVIYDPKKFKCFISPHLCFDNVIIQSNKSTKTYADILLNNILLLLPMIHLNQQTPLAKSILQCLENEHKKAIRLKIKKFALHDQDKIFGRTVFRKNKEKAYKFMKINEHISDLYKEKKILKIFYTHRDQFHSTLPKPKKIVSSHESLKEKFSIKIQEEPTIMLQFQTGEEYYNYLHTILDESRYQKGRERWLRDSLKILLRNGLFHESTPMFHNQSQTRPYIILVKLLHASSFNSAAGRLDTPRLYNQHPNIGENGIRDIRDIKNILSIAQNPSLFSKDVNMNNEGFSKVYQDIATRKKMLTANFIATHRLVDTVILAMRLENDPHFKWDWMNKKSRQTLAKEGIRGMALTVAAYSDIPYENAYSIGQESLDWDQWAKEILFWWTPDQPHSYTDYIDSKQLPNDLYPEGFSFNLKQCKNYLPGFGFCQKDSVIEILERKKMENREYTMKDLRKDPAAKLYLDVGAYNGSLLLHTLELDCYLTAGLAMILAESRI